MQLHLLPIFIVLTMTSNLCADKLDTLGTPIITEFSRSICPGDSYQGYNTNGTYIDTFTSVTNCDSIRTVHLGMYVPHPDTEEIICIDHTEPNPPELGVFVEMQIDSNGCEFTHTQTVALTSDNIITSETVCGGSDIIINNQLINSDTTIYSEEFTDLGCIYYYILELTFLPINETMIVEAQICEGDTFSWNGFHLLGEGFFIVSGTDSNGCDIRGEITLSFLPEEDCLVASNALPESTPILLYPNPTTDFIKVQGLGSSQEEQRVRIINNLGQTIFSKIVNGSSLQIDMSSYAAGAYLLVINDSSNKEKVIKFVKQ